MSTLRPDTRERSPSLSTAASIPWVAAGGAIGAAARHVLAIAAPLPFNGFPMSTLFVNVIGSFAIGLIAGWLANRPRVPRGLHAFVVTGLLAGFTTFAAFGGEFLTLIGAGAFVLAALYALASLVGSVIACFIGLEIAIRAVGRPAVSEPSASQPAAAPLGVREASYDSAEEES